MLSGIKFGTVGRMRDQKSDRLYCRRAKDRSTQTSKGYATAIAMKEIK
jgi:hypothetical protein